MPALRFQFFFFCGLVLLFCSCEEKPAEEKKVSLAADSVPANIVMQSVCGTEFCISVSPKLSPTNKLDTSAVLQYQDYASELYLIVTEEKKTEFAAHARSEKFYDENKSVIENFCDYKTPIVHQTLTLKAGPGKTKGKIGGMDTEVVSFAGKPAGMELDVLYKVAYIDAGEKIYTIVVWTLDSYKSKNLEMMDRMLYSFRKNRN